MTSADTERTKKEGEGFRPSLRWYLVLATLLGLSGWMLFGQSPPATISTFEGESMGTPYVVRLAPELSDAELAETQEATQALMNRLDRVLWSTYAEDSELSRFNAFASTEPFEVSEATAELVQRSLDIAEASEGRFDPTIGPIVRAFGFGAGAVEQAPDEAALEALRARVGYAKVTVLSNPPRLQKAHPELELDLGGIAKGQVVDDVLALLRERHPERSIMVEIGGEVCAHGRKPDGSSWRIGVQDPRTAMPRLWRAVPLDDQCMATSGDYRQFRQVNGEQVGHTMDPQTGAPRHSDLVSVTVFADRCADADAWATALLVGGQQNAQRLNPHPAVLLTIDQGSSEEPPPLVMHTLAGPDAQDPAQWLGD